MVSVSRRKFGTILGAMLGTSALAACQVVKDANGNTEVRINVSKIDAYAQAVLNGANSLVSSASIAKLLGDANLATVKTYISDISTFLEKFDTATKGLTVITWNDKTAVSIAQSILTTAENILSLIQTTLSAAQISAIPDSVSDTVGAVQTVVSLLQALLTTIAGATAIQARAIVIPTMSEEKALSILHVALPA